MVTLKRFLETGELGPLHCGMSEMDVREVLRPLQPDESVSKHALILKYGGLQLVFVKNSQSESRHLSHIAIYYAAPQAEPIPEPARPVEFTGSHHISIADVREYLGRAELRESKAVEGDIFNYLIMPSGARITFDENTLHSIQYAAPRSEQPKKQIRVPVSNEDFERLSALARKAKKSVSDLIAEGIPVIIRERN